MYFDDLCLPTPPTLTLSQANIIEKVKGKLDEDTRASLLSCKAQFRDMGK